MTMNRRRFVGYGTAALGSLAGYQLSPLSRAFRTAQLALGEMRAPMLTTEKGFMEIAHGTWEGLLASEIRERDPDRLQAWREVGEILRHRECVIQQIQSLRQECSTQVRATHAALAGLLL